mmetsp:Transcript_15965/g.48037  ORF Transcript_15965/g.48037 Transcript_15965/m.48037 type:complete len:237 (-) Transcript_15965:741-1451(-)
MRPCSVTLLVQPTQFRGAHARECVVRSAQGLPQLFVLVDAPSRHLCPHLVHAVLAPFDEQLGDQNGVAPLGERNAFRLGTAHHFLGRLAGSARCASDGHVRVIGLPSFDEQVEQALKALQVPGLLQLGQLNCVHSREGLVSLGEYPRLLARAEPAPLHLSSHLERFRVASLAPQPAQQHRVDVWRWHHAVCCRLVQQRALLRRILEPADDRGQLERVGSPSRQQPVEQRLRLRPVA